MSRFTWDSKRKEERKCHLERTKRQKENLPFTYENNFHSFLSRRISFVFYISLTFHKRIFVALRHTWICKIVQVFFSHPYFFLHLFVCAHFLHNLIPSAIFFSLRSVLLLPLMLVGGHPVVVPVCCFLRMLWGTRVQRHRLNHVGAARKIWENEFSSHKLTHLKKKFSLKIFLTRFVSWYILMKSRAQLLHLFLIPYIFKEWDVR